MLTRWLPVLAQPRLVSMGKLRPHRLGLLIAIAIVGTLAACSSPEPTATPTEAPTPTAEQPTATPVPTATATATATPAPTPTPTPTVTPTPFPTPTVSSVGTEFFLELLTPTELEIITTDATLLVSGRTRVDAVVTINDDVASPDADGRFQTTVALELGANIIEVVASVASNEQDSIVITAVYLP